MLSLIVLITFGDFLISILNSFFDILKNSFGSFDRSKHWGHLKTGCSQTKETKKGLVLPYINSLQQNSSSFLIFALTSDLVELIKAEFQISSAFKLKIFAISLVASTSPRAS